MKIKKKVRFNYRTLSYTANVLEELKDRDFGHRTVMIKAIELDVPVKIRIKDTDIIPDDELYCGKGY